MPKIKIQKMEYNLLSRHQPPTPKLKLFLVPQIQLQRCMTKYSQTCQPLVKENLEIHEKKSGDSTKNRDLIFYFFPDQTPFPSRELDTNLIPRVDRRGEKRYVIEALNTSKNHSLVEKSNKVHNSVFRY